jgi:hypothetical protein
MLVTSYQMSVEDVVKVMMSCGKDNFWWRKELGPICTCLPAKLFAASFLSAMRSYDNLQHDSNFPLS